VTELLSSLAAAPNGNVGRETPAAPGERALLLFSGGQDSTVCLAWALQRYALVETVGFDYRQRHAVELRQREQVLQQLRERFPAWAPRLGADHLLDVGLLAQLSDTALTQERRIELQANNLPNTFVPGRNLLFFTLAACLAYRRGISTLVGGMCETDYSGYPDCRHNTLQAQALTLSLGLAQPMAIETPLMWRDKAATWAMAQGLGGSALVQLIVQHTHTCYLGDREHLHDWGYGCGHCPACELRAAGWQAWRAKGGSDEARATS
jgi:7-cyano-7-deazaguanine synthase